MFLRQILNSTCWEKVTVGAQLPAGAPLKAEIQGKAGVQPKAPPFLALGLREQEEKELSSTLPLVCLARKLHRPACLEVTARTSSLKASASAVFWLLPWESQKLDVISRESQPSVQKATLKWLQTA